MTGRSRHGLHVVRDGVVPGAEPTTSGLPGPYEHGSVRVHLSSVVLAVAGRLDATTAGRLRMFLSVFTVDGGPRELVLDLSHVSAVDGDGMAPIFEAERVLSLRTASLRLASLPRAVADFLDHARRDQPVGTDRPPEIPGGPGAFRQDYDSPGRSQD